MVKDFLLIKTFLEHESNRNCAAVSASDIFSGYVKTIKESDIKSEHLSSMAKTASEKEAIDNLDKFEKMLDENKEFKRKLAMTKKYLRENPNIAMQADPAFINGLNMLDLSVEEENE